jgi:hypothetical protein
MIPAIIIIAASCNAPAPETPIEEKAAKATYSVTPAYSADFEIGSTAQAQIVLDCWKHYDNNTLDSTTAFFSDTVELIMPGMATVKLQRDSAIALTKLGRGMYSSVKSDIGVLIPVREPSKNDDWVLIWADETTKTADGKEAKRALHEVFGFDKAGKINHIHQFETRQ